MNGGPSAGSSEPRRARGEAAEIAVRVPLLSDCEAVCRHRRKGHPLSTVRSGSGLQPAAPHADGLGEGRRGVFSLALLAGLMQPTALGTLPKPTN